MLEQKQPETHGVGGDRYPVPSLQAALFGDWSWELSPLLIARWCLFMNIHPGAFRPRLISREIDEETRTFYHKRSVSPSSSSSSSSSVAFSGGCWQNSPSSLAKKKRKGKKLPEKHGTIWSSKWMGKQGFFLPIAYLVPITHVYQKKKKKKKRKRKTGNEIQLSDWVSWWILFYSL